MSEGIGTLQLNGSIYTLLNIIGYGGQGVVYRASTPEENIVACKILHIEPDDDTQHRLNFCRKKRLHVAQIIDHGFTTESVSRYLIVSEFIEGRTLEQAIQEGETFSEERALSVMEQLSIALKEFHDDALLYRDMKPSNAKINDNGNVTVIDHETVRHAALGTLSGTICMGSMQYAAPEQWSGLPTQQSDLYALGVTMWELTTGRRAQLPYHIHADTSRLDFRIYNTLPYSRGFIELIRALTQHKTIHRPASIDEVLSSIKRIRNDVEETALVTAVGLTERSLGIDHLTGTALTKKGTTSFFKRAMEFFIGGILRIYERAQLSKLEKGSYRRLATIAMENYTSSIGEIRESLESDDIETQGLARELVSSYVRDGNFKNTPQYRLRETQHRISGYDPCDEKEKRINIAELIAASPQTYADRRIPYILEALILIAQHDPDVRDIIQPLVSRHLNPTSSNGTRKVAADREGEIS